MDPFVSTKNQPPGAKYSQPQTKPNDSPTKGGTTNVPIREDLDEDRKSLFDEEFQSHLLDSPNKFSPMKEGQGATIGGYRKAKSSLAMNRFDGRPKTSSSMIRSSNLSRGRHLISQCVPSRQMINQMKNKKEHLISAMPSGRNEIGEPLSIMTDINYEKMMQQLYKIKIPQQILTILSKFVQGGSLEEVTVDKLPSPHLDEKPLSPRFKSFGQNSRAAKIESNPKIGLKEKSKNSFGLADSQHYNSTLMDGAATQEQHDPTGSILAEAFEDMRFNIKLTDLTDLENPFVIYEDKKIDSQGYLIFDNFDLSVLNPTKIFPWLMNAKDLEKRTLKIEVTFQSELVLLRFIHLDRFYEMKFPQIMLEISNNMLQNQILLQKQVSTPKPTEGMESNQTMEEEGVLVIKQINYIPQNQVNVPGISVLQNEKVKQSLDSMDNSELAQTLNLHASISKREGISLKQNETDFYYALKPVKSVKEYMLLKDLVNYKLHLRDLRIELFNKSVELQPPLMKHLRIIIEFTDCIVQAKDLVNYILIQHDPQTQKKKSSAGLIPQLAQSQARPGTQQNQKRKDGIISIAIERHSTAIPGSRGLVQSISGQKVINTKQSQKDILFPQAPIQERRPKSMIAKYGQNRNVQFLLRKNLDEQIQKNRKMTSKPKAALQMGDSRQVFEHLHNTALQSMPMPIEYPKKANSILKAYPKQSLFKGYQQHNQMNKADSESGVWREGEDLNTFSQQFKQFESYRSIKSIYMNKPTGNQNTREEDSTRAHLYPNYVRGLAAQLMRTQIQLPT